MAVTKRATVRSPLSPRLGEAEEVSRPSLQRLTSRNRDLVVAALQQGTSSTPYNGVRRSLDELGPWNKRPTGPDGHREALVHEVKAGDTVAGIALQYGLTAQALRQANRLWSTDSIHLRKTLFVPLDACTMPPAKEIIEHIEVEGESVTIYSRALPRRPLPPVAPPRPIRTLTNGNNTRTSTSLDLERLPPSSRTSIDSSASLYLPETNATYTAPSEVANGDGDGDAERLVDVEEPLAPLIERTLKLAIVPPPPSASQPFFRLSPSHPTATLPSVPTRRPPEPPPRWTKPEAVPLTSPGNSGWGADDELAMAVEFVKKSRSRR